MGRLQTLSGGLLAAAARRDREILVRDSRALSATAHAAVATARASLTRVDDKAFHPQSAKQRAYLEKFGKGLSDGAKAAERRLRSEGCGDEGQ